MQLSEFLPSMYEALGPMLSTKEKKKRIEFYSQMLMFLVLKNGNFINWLIAFG